MKRIMYILLSLLIVLSAAGCGTAKTSTDPKTSEQPKSVSAETFVENHMKATSLQQWEQLYSSLHPDVQAKYSKEQYIAYGKENGVKFAEDLKDYKVGTATTLPTWTDTKGMGPEYKDVAEIPIAYNFKDGSTEKGNMHIVKLEGSWRWFWGPPEGTSGSQVIPSRQVEFGQESDLGQFGFKILKVENTKEAKTPTKSISVTTNTYEIVKIEVTNKRSAPAQLQDYDIRLMDLDKKTVYNLNSEVTIDIGSALQIYNKQPAVYLYDDMNPNLKNEFTAVYEIPADGNFAVIITYKGDGMSLKLK